MIFRSLGAMTPPWAETKVACRVARAVPSLMATTEFCLFLFFFFPLVCLLAKSRYAWNKELAKAERSYQADNSVETMSKAKAKGRN